MDERLAELKVKYSENESKRTLKDEYGGFQMHAGKFIDPAFVEMLRKEHLASSSRDPGNPDSINWLTMHPTFGSAMMSILAVAVARLRGLSVVAPSGRVSSRTSG